MSRTMETVAEMNGATLIHMAGIVGEQAIRGNEAQADWVNVSSLPVFLRACLEAGMSKVIYVSSGHVYGPHHSQPIPESSPLAPSTKYGELKARAEALFSEEASKLGLEFGILRPFSIIGSNMPDFTLYGAVQRALKSGSVLSYSEDVRDFADPRLLAEAIFRGSSSNLLNQGRIVNLCTGEPTSVRECAESISLHETGRHQQLRVDSKHSSFPYLVGDPSEMRKLLGPQTKLRPEWLKNALNDSSSS